MTTVGVVIEAGAYCSPREGSDDSRTRANSKRPCVEPNERLLERGRDGLAPHSYAKFARHLQGECRVVHDVGCGVGQGGGGGGQELKRPAPGLRLIGLGFLRAQIERVPTSVDD